MLAFCRKIFGVNGFFQHHLAMKRALLGYASIAVLLPNRFLKVDINIAHLHTHLQS